MARSLIAQWLGIALLPLVMVSGCARHASVSGTVTYEGKPVPRGSVVLIPVGEGQPDKEIGRAEIRSDGGYSITNQIPGKKRVVAAASREFHFPSEETDRLPPPVLDFPDDAVGNGQVVELKPGANKVDIALTKPAGKAR